MSRPLRGAPEIPAPRAATRGVPIDAVGVGRTVRGGRDVLTDVRVSSL